MLLSTVFKIDIMSRLFYTVIISSVLILMFLLVRRILGHYLKPAFRMGLWHCILGAVPFCMLCATNQDALYTFYIFRFYKGRFSEPVRFIFDVLYADYANSGKVVADVVEWVGLEIYCRIFGWSESFHFLNATLALNLLFGIWLTGFILFSIGHLITYSIMLMQLREIPNCNDDWTNKTAFYEKTAMGVSFPVNVKLIPTGKQVLTIDGPCVIGFAKPTLILPENQWMPLEEEEKTAVLDHMMLHIKKRDRYLNLILGLTQSVFWFHFILWKGIKCLRFDLECLRDQQLKSRYIEKSSIQNYVKAMSAVNEMSGKKNRGAVYRRMQCFSGMGLRERLLANDKKVNALLAWIIFLLMIWAIRCICIYGRLAVIFQYLDAIRHGVPIP